MTDDQGFDPGPAILFVPADRPDRFAKAAARADAVILDLEDGVDVDRRAIGRRAVVASRLDPRVTVVRVNPADSPEFAEDVLAVRATDYRTVMLAKTERVDQLDALARAIPGVRIVALCETAAGVVHAESIAAHPSVVAVMWGAEDLVASLGGTSSRHADGRYRDVAVQARSRVLLAAGAAGVLAIDAVHLDLDDQLSLAAEAEDASEVGFAATACIHPAQVAIIRDAYRPGPEAVLAAKRLLEASSGEAGAFRHDGRMVDEPLLRHARALLARAAKTVGHEG